MRQPKVLAEPIFVGRKQELKDLTQLLERTIAGRGSTIFISGEAGSGKTRLINEFLNIIQKREITILSGWCLSNAALPYFPFIEAFSSDLSSREGGAIVSQQLSMRSLLSEAYPTEKLEKNKTVAPQVWKDQAFASVTRELLFMSSVKPLILVLEDMHWADSASLALLHYISRAIANEKILVLVTFRSEELGRDAEGRRHPLVETVQLMGREGLFKEMKLANLSQDGVRGIAESMLGGKVNLEFIGRLSEESRGNPLFVVEFLRMLSEQGTLVREEDQWRLSVEKLGMPSKVKEVIMRRIGALKPDQRRVLDVASVIGDKFNPDLIGAVLSKDHLEILEVLNNILKSTSLVRVEENWYRFDHAKSREVLYEQISLPLKQGYHERIAEQIEDASQNGKEVSFSDLAYHYAQAGDKEKSVKYALAAGRDAVARFSNAEAINHFKYVLESVANLEELTVERNVALEGMGDAFLASNMFKESTRIFEDLAKSTDDEVVRLRAFRKAMDSAFQLGDISHLMGLIEKAEPYANADRLERARILVSRGRAFHLQSMLSAATRDMEEALKIFEEEYSLRDVAWTLIGLGVYHAGAGMPQEGLAESLCSIAIFEELGDLRWQTEAYYVAGMAFNFCFLEQEALKILAKVSEIEKREKMGDYTRLVYADAFSGRSFESMGDFENALACSLKALESSKKTDSLLAKGVVYSDLTRQYARLGMIDRAEEYFEKLMQIPPKILADPRTIVSLAKSAFYAGKSQWRQSNKHFIEFLEGSGLFNFPEFVLGIARLYYAWALKKQGLFSKAREILEENQKKRQEAKIRFEQLKLRVNFIVPTRVKVGQKFEGRLDIVNVSRCLCHIKSIENFMDPRLEIASVSPGYKTGNGSIDMGNDVLNPFQIKTITLSFQAKYPGEISLNPKVIYVDDFGKTKICNTKNIQIVVEPIISTKVERIEFKSDYAQKAFDFLIKAFLEDYLKHKLPLEKSGWRTLMEVVKNGQVSKHSMYGRSGRGGKVTSELEHLGLVESRFFLGERGRGGRVLKIRVCHKKENVKQLLDQRRGKK